MPPSATAHGVAAQLLDLCPLVAILLTILVAVPGQSGVLEWSQISPSACRTFRTNEPLLCQAQPG